MTQEAIFKVLPILEKFIGEWKIEISYIRMSKNPRAKVYGKGSFRWKETDPFLLCHTEIAGPIFPVSDAVIGFDEITGEYGMLYSDSRGVSRIYRMTFEKDHWILWRVAPGFSQRFNGWFSDDGNTINAKWEISTDNMNWEDDLAMVYSRVKK